MTERASGGAAVKAERGTDAEALEPRAVGMMRAPSATAIRSAAVAAGFAAGFAAVTLLERRVPLRREREPTAVRLARNLAVAVLSAAAVSLLDRPVIVPIARCVERARWGLTFHAGIPEAARTTLAIILLDYTLYVWHVLLHRVPLLWRCHLVHHIDRDLDASTALRFHFTELLLSIPWRAAQVIAIGVTPRALSMWQRALFASVLFHHSNIRLPIAVERALNRAIVTPRMHGIHHSMVPEHLNSNWSSGLTIWDVLHGTACLNVPQREITIGVAGYQDPEAVTLRRALALPFEPRQRAIATKQ